MNVLDRLREYIDASTWGHRHLDPTPSYAPSHGLMQVMPSTWADGAQSYVERSRTYGKLAAQQRAIESARCVRGPSRPGRSPDAATTAEDASSNQLRVPALRSPRAPVLQRPVLEVRARSSKRPARKGRTDP